VGEVFAITLRSDLNAAVNLLYLVDVECLGCGTVDHRSGLGVVAFAVGVDAIPHHRRSTVDGDDLRAIANVRDADTLYLMTTEPWEGRQVKITNDGRTNTAGAA